MGGHATTSLFEVYPRKVRRFKENTIIADETLTPKRVLSYDGTVVVENDDELTSILIQGE